MSCPHCQAPLIADARFCPACGKATAPTEAYAHTMAVTPDLVGRDIGGRFRVLSLLGEGGMGAVYRGEQTSLRRPCAIKVLKPELCANQMLTRRFNAEAAAVAKLSHPNTVTIYEFGQDQDGSLFIAMELIDGRSLRKVVQAEAPIAPQRALDIATQIAASLADAHSHDIVHRDLKPDNVMLQDKGKRRDIARVLDFGIAKLRDDTRGTQAAMTQAGDMLGTPQYMAPEQIKGEVVDGRADIYALGCIIYEMVTGRQPFEAATVMAMLSKHLLEEPVAPSVRRPDLGISPEIDRLVLAAMHKDPRARPATMELYGEQIAQVAAMLPPGAPRVTGQGSGALPPAYSPPPGLPYGTPAQVQPTPVQPAFTPAPPSYSPVPPTYVPPTYVPPRHAAPRGPNLVLWIVAGAVVVAGIVIGVRFLRDSSSNKPKVEHVDHWDDPAPAPEPAPAPPPPAPTPSNDPWANSSAPRPAPAPAPAPAPHHTAATHAISCDQIAAHAAELIQSEISSHASQLTPEQLEQMKPQLQASIDAFHTQCVTTNPPDRQRECFLRSQALAEAMRCK